MQWEETRPVPGHEAFGRADPVAVHSQAAFLLVLARQGRSDYTKPDYIVGGDTEDEELLDIPDWGGAAAAGLAVARMQWPERRAPESAVLPPMEANAVAGSAQALYDSPSADAAVGLIKACLDAPHPLVRVAAAAADLHLGFQAEDLVAMTDRISVPASSMHEGDSLVHMAAAGPGDLPARIFPPARRPLPGHATEVLMRGAGDQDELVRDIAISALEGARFHFENQSASGPEREGPPDHSARRRGGSPSAPNDRSDGRFSIVVHGTTFGRRHDWWRPGRAFPAFLRAEVAPNLYAGRRPFFWSGLYNHPARELGAVDLADWAGTLGPLDHVLAYSHGGSVAMMASQRGVRMNKLVLLSCPVHTPYTPDFGCVRKVVSVRTRLDLVILADGGRQRFRDSRINEHVLPLWFSHKATRQTEVWRRHRIAAML